MKSAAWMGLVAGLLLIGAAHAAESTAVSGAKVFEANCQVCHQAGGVGVAGEFPRLAGRVSVIASSAEGRLFLSKLMLNGMSGSVTVDGERIIGVMPGFGQLSDGDLAAALTYVSDLDAGKKRPRPLTAADIAAGRSAKSSPSAMATERNDLASRKLIP